MRPPPLGQQGRSHGATRESDPVKPRKSRPAACQLFFDDPPPGFIHDRVPALTKLGNQCRLTAA